MQRPTFFISSTIYDFRDLRSALKYFLEEQGCKVLASEYNDFEKPLDKHSYDACLDAIKSADYFVLLVGSRVGGWFDEPSKVSITQREYREAYKLHKAGKLKLLNFVRSEVWHVKEDRQALSKVLAATELDPARRAVIANHSSKLAENAEFITNFLNEIGRNAETKAATNGKGPAPTGNWIHMFSGFREVIDALNAQVFASIPIEDLTARRLLRRELRDFVSQSLVKINKNIYSPRPTIDTFHRESPIILGKTKNQTTNVSKKLWARVSLLSANLLNRKVHATVLPQVLARPTFLEFDVTSNSYRETEVQLALVRLQDEIQRFNHSNTSEIFGLVKMHAQTKDSTPGDVLAIDTMKLAALLNVFDRWSNILDLSAAILHYLEGGPFRWPDLRPETPVKGMQEEIDAERPTEQEISAYVASYR